MNPPGGALGAPTSIAGPANSAGLVTMAPVGVNPLFLYVSDPQDSAIHVYQVNPADGSLSVAPLGPFSLGSGNGVPGEMVAFYSHPSGYAIYVAGSTGNIVAFHVNPDGSLTAMPGSPFAAGTGLSHMVFAVSTTVGNTSFLYAANSGDPNGSISAFNVTSSGALVPVPGSPFPTVAGAGPEGFFDGGRFLYLALSNANAVAAFAIANDGSLTPLAGSPFPARRGTFSVTGVGGFLFAMNHLDGTISSYSVDWTGSGSLTPVAGSPFRAVVPSGDTLYFNGSLFVPDASSNSIVGFKANADGSLSSVMGSPFQAGAGTVTLTSAGFPVIDPP